MIQTVVGKRHFFRIIQSIYKQNPEVAKTLDSILAPGSETDLSRIFFFYSRFDNIDMRGYNPVNRRRVFIGVMMQMFNPYCLENGLSYSQYGFVKNIAACFSCKPQSITKNIREVVVMYRAYEEFQEKVNEVLEEFKTMN